LRALKSKLYKWFQRNNTYCYLEVLFKFVSGYNDTVHSSTGMALSLVSDKDVLRIWDRIRKRQARIGEARSPNIFSVGQTVRISKERIRWRSLGFRSYYACRLSAFTSWRTCEAS
jgi:hypothetical protein